MAHSSRAARLHCRAWIPPSANLPRLLARLRTARQARKPDYQQRRNDLQRLRDALKRRLTKWARAISADSRPSLAARIAHRRRHTVLNEIDHPQAPARLDEAAQGRRGLAFAGARGDARGAGRRVGVIAPWNYPVNLALIPLATATRPATTSHLKPSEHIAAHQCLPAPCWPRSSRPSRVAVAEGGAEVAAAFAALLLDHLVFTGSTRGGAR